MATHQVVLCKYSVHEKKDAPPSHPKSIKCSYKTANDEWFNRWVCPEHDRDSFAGRAFVKFWSEHMSCTPADTAEECVQLLMDSAKMPKLIETQEGKNGWPEITAVLFDVPETPREKEEQSEPEPSDVTYDDIPF